MLNSDLQKLSVTGRVTLYELDATEYIKNSVLTDKPNTALFGGFLLSKI